MKKTIITIITAITALWLAACDDDGITPIDQNTDDQNSENWDIPYDSSGTAGGHTYVDIGTSVLWSACNIGGTHPLMPGTYFAWGETTPKETYTWDTYKHCDAKHRLTKYNYQKESGSKGMTDDIYTLTPEDDAAVQNWGEGWRMPTKEEFDELRSQCTWEWIKTENTNYYKVTGPSGKSILLPACGCIKNTKRIMNKDNGCLWSSSISDNIPEHGCELTQYATGYWTGSADRFYGEPIRPVIDHKNINKTSNKH